MAKVPVVAQTLSFYPRGGVEIKLIFTLRAVVSEIQVIFQSCHIWVWNLALGKSSRSCTCTLFLTHGVEIEATFTLQAMVIKIEQYLTLIRLISYVNILLLLPRLIGFLYLWAFTIMQGSNCYRQFLCGRYRVYKPGYGRKNDNKK